MEEEGIEELMKSIEDTIGGFDTGFNQDLMNYVAELQRHMQGGDFNSRSGDLRRSMNASVINDYAIQISMVYYGYFLAFGVDIRGLTGKKTFGVDSEVANALNVARRGRQIASDGTWRFGQASKANRVFGIAARGTSTPAEFSDRSTFYPRNVLNKLEHILLKNNETL